MVKPSLTGIDSAQGVRQVLPFDARASAPVGFEWMVTVPVEGELNRSRFGRPRLAWSSRCQLESDKAARPFTVCVAVLALNLMAQPNAIDRFPSPGPTRNASGSFLVLPKPSLHGSGVPFNQGGPIA